jgi:hypothetical protein
MYGQNFFSNFLEKAGSRHLPQWRVRLSSIAFQMLENQSQLKIDKVIDESCPNMTRSISRKVEELSIVSRAARSLSAISRGMSINYQNSDFSSKSAAPDTLSIAVVVAKIFRDANIPYAIGGALACGVWSVPRGTMEGLSKLEIEIPKNKQLITDMNSTFQEIDTLQRIKNEALQRSIHYKIEIKNANELYKQYIQELGNEAKQRNIIAIKEEESNVVINEHVQD